MDSNCLQTVCPQNSLSSNSGTLSSKNETTDNRASSEQLLLVKVLPLRLQTSLCYHRLFHHQNQTVAGRSPRNNVEVLVDSVSELWVGMRGVDTEQQTWAIHSNV